MITLYKETRNMLLDFDHICMYMLGCGLWAQWDQTKQRGGMSVQPTQPTLYWWLVVYTVVVPSGAVMTQ